MGNYVTNTRPDLGNYMTADRGTAEAAISRGLLMRSGSRLAAVQRWSAVEQGDQHLAATDVVDLDERQPAQTFSTNEAT